MTQKYSQDFTDLKCDLENFQNTFDEFFTEDHKVNLGVAITMKQDEVKKLDKEINMWVDSCLCIYTFLYKKTPDSKVWDCSYGYGHYTQRYC